MEKILLIHVAPLLTCLKLSGLSLGLIINWNMVLLRDGSQRVVRKHLEELTSGREWTRQSFLGVLGGWVAGETFASKLAPKSIEFSRAKSVVTTFSTPQMGAKQLSSKSARESERAFAEGG